MDNETSGVGKFINNNVNIREKIRVEEVLGLMDIPKTIIIHNMRQNFKLEKEASASQKNVSSLKDQKNSIFNSSDKKDNLVIMRNPYGVNLTAQKTNLQSNFVFNKMHREKESLQNNQESQLLDFNNKKAKIHFPEKNMIKVKFVNQLPYKIPINKSNIIKTIKNFNYTSYSSNNEIRRGNLNDYLRCRYEEEKEKVFKDSIIKNAQEKQVILDNEIKNVEKLREAFTDLLPKVMDSIKIIENNDKSFSTKNSKMSNKKANKSKGISNDVNSNENDPREDQNNFDLRNNAKKNFIQQKSLNKYKKTGSSKTSSYKSLKQHNFNLNCYKKPAYEDQYVQENLFYNPNEDFFVKNKYKQFFK